MRTTALQAGGRTKARFPAYANGWHGRCQTPAEYAAAAVAATRRGYEGIARSFGIASASCLLRKCGGSRLVEAVRRDVSEEIKIMIEGHGRLSVGTAVEMGRRLEKYHPAWFEEPVTPHSLDLLLEVKKSLPVASSRPGNDFTPCRTFRLTALRAADVVQMDIARCGGLLMSKKIAGMAQAQDLQSFASLLRGAGSPVRLCILVGQRPTFTFRNIFGEYDVPGGMNWSAAGIPSDGASLFCRTNRV